MFHECLEREQLGAGIETGMITLLYKKGGWEKLENWRLIILLNLDYKMMAKVLVNRFKKSWQRWSTVTRLAQSLEEK